MKDVKLESMLGDHIGWAQIPEFDRCPRVLFLGPRVFSMHQLLPPAYESEKAIPYLVYREVVRAEIISAVTIERAQPAAPAPGIAITLSRVGEP
jgi:hypothetical protein